MYEKTIISFVHIRIYYCCWIARANIIIFFTSIVPFWNILLLTVKICTDYNVYTRVTFFFDVCHSNRYIFRNILYVSTQCVHWQPVNANKTNYFRTNFFNKHAENTNTKTTTIAATLNEMLKKLVLLACLLSHKVISG